jgi:phage tail-like protein
MRPGDANGTRYWVLRTREHWLRCDHASTALDAERLHVTLARRPVVRPKPGQGEDPAASRYGVAWDSRGRLWRAVPASAGQAGHVERLSESGTVIRLGEGPEPVDGGTPGDFELVDPRGLAIDGTGLLYIADSGIPHGAAEPVAGGGRLLIIDLRDGRAIARLKPPAVAGRTPRPWDLIADPRGAGAYLLDRGTRAVWHLLPDRAPLQLLGLGGGWERAGQESLSDPTALAIAKDGALVVLDRAPSGVRVVWARPRDVRLMPLPAGPGEPHAVDATCLALDGEERLVVGGHPEATLLRYNVESAPDELELDLHLLGEAQPWGFDGGALVADGNGDVLFTTPNGVGAPALAYPGYETRGEVVTFALDSGIGGCVWHRLFIEASLPERTGLQVRTRTSDTLEPLGVGVPTGDFPVRPPQGFDEEDVRRVEAAPTYAADAPDWTPVPRLLRRPAGADRPLYTPEYTDGAAIDLYEGLVLSPPGRYLWLHLTLIGTDRVSPAVVGMRVYYPRPSYLRYLPTIFREDPRSADFLDRFLSIFETFHSELDGVRDHLAALFQPMAAPSEALDWLAGWVGMVLDPRWPEDRRRRLVAEAARLYRERGTKAGLERFLALYLNQPFQIIEGFQTRRAGGVVVGGRPESGQSVVGQGLVLNEPQHLLSGTRAWAHRFTVFVAGALSEEERAVVMDILELEKPAHTLAELCDVNEALSVGRRALVGISTVVGRAPRLQPSVVGGETWPLGRDGVLGGRPGGRRGSIEIGTINLGRNTVIR